MKKVLCFGELLLRMSPTLQQYWLQQAQMPVYLGGAELNVATALGAWNMPVRYCTALPDHYISQEIVSALTDKKIDTSAILYTGERVGLYFLPQGTDLKHGSVVYDRAHSSFSNLQPGMVDWEKVLDGIDWFHFSAINPALNSNLTAVCKEALETAVRKNITVSVDLNYRSKLWQWGKQPVEVIPALVAYCDVVMANIWSTETMLGIEIDKNIHDKKSKQAYTEQACRTEETIQQRFPKCKIAANTFRFDEGTGVRYYTTLYQQSQHYVSKEFCSTRVKDKAGSGDCFMAGLIYGLRNGHQPQTIIDFAAAAAFGKLHEKGDATQQDIAAVQLIIATHE